MCPKPAGRVPRHPKYSKITKKMNPGAFKIIQNHKNMVTQNQENPIKKLQEKKVARWWVLRAAHWIIYIYIYVNIYMLISSGPI